MDTQIEREALSAFRRLLDTDPSLQGDFDVEITSLAPAVASRVRSMLAALRSHSAELPATLDPSRISPPHHLGEFVLGERLGQGGMGVVFAAEKRQGEVVLAAAVKWLPAAGSDPSRRARFLFEQQVVARLSHPAIARLIDAGETPSGDLWYAMERIHGQQIDTYCRTQKLNLRSRLELILQTAEGLSYAHRNLVLHRDIKPGNVLVTDDGKAKLIDFGIAKTLRQDVTALTQEHAPLTLRYASPEQLAQETLTTRSDVWQLAALAYELLSGRPVRKSLGTDPIVCVSVAASDSGETHAATLGIKCQQLVKVLEGDIDAVLAKALRQRPEERYSNVEDFSDDLRAILTGMPVAARRGESWYLSLAFVRRHWVSLGLAAVVLVLGLSMGWLAIDRAREEAQTAERTVALLSEILVSIPENDEGGNGNTMTVPILLARANAQILDNPELQPAHRKSLSSQIARRALDLGAEQAALQAATANLSLSESLFGSESIEVAEALDLLAEVKAIGMGDTSEALRLIEKSADLHGRLGDTRTRGFLDHLVTRGFVQSQAGTDDAALESIRLAAELSAQVPDADPGTHELHLAQYSMFLRSYGHWEQAEEVINDALARLDALGNTAPAAAVAKLESEACIVHSNQATPIAIEICRRRVDSIDRAGALESLGGSTALLGLAIAQNNLDKSDDALKTIERAEAVTLAFEGRNPRSQNMRHIQLTRARILRRLSRWDESANAFREAIRLFAERDPETSVPRVNRTRLELMEVLVEADRLEDARELALGGIEFSAEDEEYRARYQAAVARLGLAVPSGGSEDPQAHDQNR